MPTSEKDRQLVDLVNHAYIHAPAIRRIFDDAGVRPQEIHGSVDLERIPVTSKERLLELQRADPPFGGFLGTELSEVRRIFVSPGPIYEPDAGLRSGRGFGTAVRTAGVGPGDIVLNTWSYHLVPAGVVLDDAFGSCGATVIPGGVGNSEAQARVMVDLGVTVLAASTAFFETLVQRLEALGYHLPSQWRLRCAFLGGEFGDWAAKRRQIEQDFGISTFSFYGTADIGLIGYECRSRDGYHVAPDVIVEVCDPVSGRPVADGVEGEVVATSFNPAWPLIRFGTGDASALSTTPCPCGDSSPKLMPLTGRTAESLKVREIFVYPRHIRDLVARVQGLVRAQGVVVRSSGRDEIDLRIELRGEELGDWSSIEHRIREEFTALTRLRARDVILASPGEIPNDGPLLLNSKAM